MNLGIAIGLIVVAFLYGFVAGFIHDGKGYKAALDALAAWEKSEREMLALSRSVIAQWKAAEDDALRWRVMVAELDREP